MSMSNEEMARRLNGCEYGEEVSDELEEMAQQFGLVIVFGASDDLTIFKGAIQDEGGYGEIHLGKDSLLTSECDEEDCPYFEKVKAAARTIKAVWQDGQGEYCFVYETDIPHATFDVMEDGDKYCKGIVFNVEEIS